jgi:type II secretory pathway predicted ATPase ExeA
MEQPFGVTPDPRFLYLGTKHREALASLVYGTESGRGFIALTAKPGMGKTSLLFQYLESLRNKARTAFVFQTDCHRRELLRHILSDLGLDATGKDLPAMHEMFNQILLQEMNAGRRFVLVIDEAQNLEEKVLESVRLLSNFETPWMKLMQIVIAGQPQLAERLAKPSLTQLRQRISMIVKIEPFTYEETQEYIQHRLSVAGYKGQSLFTAGARSMIAERSEGIPRNINNICFNAMSLGCATKRKAIDREIVTEVLADLDLGTLNGEAHVTPKAEEIPKFRIFDVPWGVRRRPHSRRWALGFVTAGILAALSWQVEDLIRRESQAASPDRRMEIPFERPTAQVSTDSTSTVGADAPSIQPKETTPAQESMALTKQEEQQPDNRVSILNGSRTITILPGQTIYRIAVNNIGYYNEDILRELRAVNPWLVDPRTVKSGQTVVIPSIRDLSADKLPAIKQGIDLADRDVEKQ